MNSIKILSIKRQYNQRELTSVKIIGLYMVQKLLKTIFRIILFLKSTIKQTLTRKK